MAPALGLPKGNSRAGTRALFGSVRDQNDIEVVDKLLAAAAAREDLRFVHNSIQQSLLLFAVQRKRNALEVCRLLLDKYNIDVNHEDKNGQTALHFLATNNSADSTACVDLLVARKSEVNHADRILDQTPLFYAASKGTGVMVRKLLDHSADASVKDRHSKTALCWAAHPDTCKELAMQCSLSHGGICDSKQALASGMDTHRLNRNPQCASYLATCAEVWAFRGRTSWMVRGNPGSSSAYITGLARPRDVLQLCALESDFISDHRVILSSPGTQIDDDDLFDQIGLSPDPQDRQNTIKSITRVHAGPQTKSIRHYTLVCHALKEDPHSSLTQPRSTEAIGYVYFKVCDGDREAGGQCSMDVDDSSDEDRRALANSDIAIPLPNGAIDLADDPPEKSNGYVVISHVKVSNLHQKLGVATLLLASIAQFAEKESEAFKCGGLYLSVAARNQAATALYRKLGFTTWQGNAPKDGWLSMKQMIKPSKLSVLWRQWLQLAWDDSTVMRAELLQKHVQLEAGRKRKLSPCASSASEQCASEVSTSVGSSVSSSAWSAFSRSG